MELENIFDSFDYEFTKSFVMSAESTFKDLDGPGGVNYLLEQGLGTAGGYAGLLLLGPLARIAINVLRPIVHCIDETEQENKKKMIRSALDVNSNAFQRTFQRLFTENGVETFYEYNVHNKNDDGGFKIYAQIGTGENAKGCEREAIQILGTYAGACALNYLAITGQTATLSQALTQESVFRKFKSWFKLWTQDKLYTITKNKNGEEKKVFISAYTFFLKKSLATQIRVDHNFESDPINKGNSTTTTNPSEAYKIRKEFTSTSDPTNISERLYLALLNDPSYTSTSDQEMWAQIQEKTRDFDDILERRRLQSTTKDKVRDHDLLEDSIFIKSTAKDTGCAPKLLGLRYRTAVNNATEDLNLEQNKVGLEEVKKLEELLHGDLVALKIAMAFILEERKRCETDGFEVQSFITEFSLKQEYIRKLSLHTQTEDSILLVTTLSLTLETITEIGPAGKLAVTILNCIAHLSDWIPKEFLCGLFQERENNHKKNELIADAIVLLLDYSLIGIDHSEGHFTCDLRLRHAILTLQQHQRHQDDVVHSNNDTMEVKILLEVAQKLQDFITYFKICDHFITHLVVVADRILDRLFHKKFEGFIRFVASVLSKRGKHEEALKYKKYTA